MDSEKKMELITRNAEEVMTRDDLKSMIEQGVPLKHYIGFEISGKIHIGTGIATMLKVKDFQKAGVKCTIFLADWHSWINDKLGGDLETIGKIAGGYFREGMKASLECVGGSKEIDFVLGSELYHNNDEYWQTVIDISKNITLARTMRSITIMGRKEGEAVDFAKLIYPPMQAADIFVQGINIAHAGTDQRSAHVIAREAAERLKYKALRHKGKKYKPVAVHTHLLLGLHRPAVWPLTKEKAQELLSTIKMSKSMPSSAIFIHDSEEEIMKKIMSAFCPEKITEYNPIIDWANHIILSSEKPELKIERPEKYGGDATIYSYAELEREYTEGRIHPLDIKKAVADYLIKLLEPARKHFQKGKAANMLEELNALKITR